VREALERALVEEGDRLYALALRVTRDKDLAGDAVHDAFVAALDHAGEFRGEARLSTWLHRIVYSKAVDLLRARGRLVALPDEAEPEGADLVSTPGPSWARPPDEVLLSAETRQALEEALQELTPIQRAAFELGEVEGLSSEEVGERLGIPAGTARVYRHRARLRLRALLGPRFRGARP
jgi:RNA polymerase sigma-70 factor (ECF subfamily)